MLSGAVAQQLEAELPNAPDKGSVLDSALFPPLGETQAMRAKTEKVASSSVADPKQTKKGYCDRSRWRIVVFRYICGEIHR